MARIFEREGDRVIAEGFEQYMSSEEVKMRWQRESQNEGRVIPKQIQPSGPEDSVCREIHPNLTYLSVPYSHPDFAVRCFRFECANKLAAKCVEAGHFVYSPISHWHPIAIGNALPIHAEYWKRQNEIMMEYSKLVLILKLPEWEESKGVRDEIDYAKRLGIRVEYLSKDVVCVVDRG